ncbi:MAG: flagellar hook-associated protein FlgK [Lysobacterales bacterium]
MTIESIGLSALAAFQRALSVTANNITNANTPGYSRRSVVFGNLPGNLSPVGQLGGGVEITAVRRSFDALAFNQLRQATSNFTQTQVRSELAFLVDGFLGADGFDLTSPINRFSASWQDLSTDPTSLAARTSVLSEAGSMADRFNVLDQRLNDVRSDLGNRIQAYSREINGLSARIGDLNRRINDEQTAGTTPNDLTDLRNQAVLELSEYLDIQVVQDGVSLNISLSDGSAIVTGTDVNQVQLERSEFDPSDIRLVLGDGVGDQPVTAQNAGGRMAGALSFLDNVLNPTQNELGRVAMGLAFASNQQHQRGLDANGNLGLALFNQGAPQVFPSSNNSNLSSDTTSASIEDLGSLSADDYQLDFDGSNWSLTNLRSGAGVALTPDGSDFLAEGMRFTVDPGAAAGDTYLIRPTRLGAADLEVAISNPDQLAASRALNTDASAQNLGNGQITDTTITDFNNPALLDDVDIVFTSATTYSINGGADIAYAPGSDIELNGWQLAISGSPSAGDTFTVRNNIGGVGDGGNAGLLGSVERLDTLEGQTLSVLDAYQQMVSTVGVTANTLDAATIVQGNLLADAETRQSNISGVNLDEEAVNLQRYQQAYAAAAEVFSVANEMFDTLIRSVR